MNNRKNREGDFYATDIERMIMESHYLNALESMLAMQSLQLLPTMIPSRISSTHTLYRGCD